MAAVASIDLSGRLPGSWPPASPDLLRQMLVSFVDALMGADTDAICDAPYNERS